MVRKARGQPPNELLPSTGQKLTRAPACQSWCGSSPDILGLNLVSRKGALWEIARHSRIIKYVMPTLLEIFPDARQLLALEPEELAGALIEIIPGGRLAIGWLYDREFHGAGFLPTGWPLSAEDIPRSCSSLCRSVVVAGSSRTRHAKCYPAHTVVLGDKVRASTN
jgi:hypothetical protein